MAQTPAGDLAERVVHHALRTADAVRPDSEMFITVQTTVFYMDEYEGHQDDGLVLVFRLGRTHNGTLVAALCGKAEEMRAEGRCPDTVVFDPTSQPAQLLMARTILQHVCSQMPDAPLDCNPNVDTVAFQCRLVTDPHAPESLRDLSWGQRLGGLRVKSATDWDVRMDRLTKALVGIMECMVGTYSSMRPGVNFGANQATSQVATQAG